MQAEDSTPAGVSRDANFPGALARGDIAFRRFTGRPGLDGLGEAWKCLSRTLSEPRFFHLFGWYRAYLDALAPDPDQVHFYVATRNGSAVGIFPLQSLVRPLRGVPLRWLELPRHSHMNLGDAVFARTPENAGLLSALVEHLRDQRDVAWDVLSLPRTLEDSAVAYCVREAPPARLVTTADGCSRYVPCLGSPEAMRTRLPAPFRRNLRRLQRHAQKSGQLAYRAYRTPEELDEAMPVFLDVEASGWKGARGAGSAIALHAPLVAFYGQLVRCCLPEGPCIIHLLWLEGRCIAGQFSLLVGRVLYILKIGFAEDHAHLAPGNLLMERVLEECCASGELRAVSFVTDPPWSHLWRPQSHAVLDHRVYNPTWRGSVGYLAHILALRLASLARGARQDDPREAD